jgi:hypothetical protein
LHSTTFQNRIWQSLPTGLEKWFTRRTHLNASSTPSSKFILHSLPVHSLSHSRVMNHSLEQSRARPEIRLELRSLIDRRRLNCSSLSLSLSFFFAVKFISSAHLPRDAEAHTHTETYRERERERERERLTETNRDRNRECSDVPTSSS